MSFLNYYIFLYLTLFFNVWFQKISIPPPPHGRDLPYDPPFPLDFPKSAPKIYQFVPVAIHRINCISNVIGWRQTRESKSLRSHAIGVFLSA